MWTHVKASLRRPLSKGDLLKAAEHHLSDPPFPPKLRDAIAKIRVSSAGDSLLDHWRGTFTAVLDTISQASTWKLQRSSLLKAIIAENNWVAAYLAVGKATHDESWVPLLTEIFSNLDNPNPARYKDLLFQRWIVAITMVACLQVLGASYYNLDQIKQRELSCLDEWQAATRILEVSLMDQMLNAIEANPSVAKRAWQIHSDTIVPVLRSEWGSLAVIKEDVVNRQLDLPKVQTRLKELIHRQQELEQLFRSLL